MGAAAAALAQKLSGSAPLPLVELDATGSCTSECCEDVEVVSSSSSSEPHTHESGHAATESYNTVPPDIENTCASGTCARAPGLSRASGEMRATKL